MRFSGKVALVTGGASGIGLAVARQLSGEGAAVAIVDRNPAGEQVAGALRAEGKRAEFVRADLADPESPPRVIADVTRRLGRLDVLVNNAAVLLPKAIGAISPAEWDGLMAVNLRAPFLMIQAATDALKAGKGVVVNVGSVSALRVWGDNIPYITAKAGLIGMSKAVAHDLRPFGVRVIYLAPGGVDTPLLEEDRRLRGRANAESIEAARKRGVVASPEQIARVVAFLASDDAAVMTGSVVVADCGALVM